MRRWTKLTLCLLALGLAAAPLSAQKLLADPQLGYTMYAHNFSTLQDGIDAPGGGTYVYVLGNGGLFGGAPTLGDSIRKCYTHAYLRGGQESLLSRPNMSAWSFVIASNAVVVVGQQAFFTVGEVGTGSDFCISPFNTNTFFLMGGTLVGAFNSGAPAGAWIFVFFSGVGAGAPLSPGLAFATLNNGTCLSGTMIYELQHGYNATALNQAYIGLVSIDEIVYPVTGGIAEGNPGYGANEWAAINVVPNSFTRFFDAPSPPFGGGNFGVITLLGQSVEGAADGLDATMAVAFTEAPTNAGRENGALDGSGASAIFFGAGGADWVSCGTATGLGVPTLFNLRSLDYEYGQYDSPGSVAFDVTKTYSAEFEWSGTARNGSPTNGGVGACSTVSAGSAVPPYQASPIPLDLAIIPDLWTTIFDTNPKALANAKFGHNYGSQGPAQTHTNDVTTPLNFILIFDGNEPAAAVDPIYAGTSHLPRGDLQILNLCQAKAAANILPANGPFYVQVRIRCTIVSSGATTEVETGLTVCMPIF